MYLVQQIDTKWDIYNITLNYRRDATVKKPKKQQILWYFYVNYRIYIIILIYYLYKLTLQCSPPTYKKEGLYLSTSTS